MKIIAMIQAGVVVNTAAWSGDSEWWDLMSEQFLLVDITGKTVGIGWTYDGTDFSPPNYMSG